VATAPAVSDYDHVRIGSRVFPFTGFAEVSAAYRATIDRLGLGASQTPTCKIFDGTGRQTAYVSYNGRVWVYDATDPFDHDNSNVCLYDPRPGGRFPLPLHRAAPAMQVPA
jgi:hypothetical protein